MGNPLNNEIFIECLHSLCYTTCAICWMLAEIMDLADNYITILAAGAVPAGDGTGTVGGLILFMGIALGFSFLCSLLEAGLLSTPMSFIETRAQEGGRAARLMQKHKNNVEEPITAILTLNTIAHTVGASGAGAQAVGVFGSEWLGLITAVLTFLILAFSEIIPKTLGAIYWKQLASFTAYTVQLLIISLYPAVWGFKMMTRLITPDEKMPTVSRTELEMMAHISTEEGTLEEKESRILRNLLHLNGVQVGDIMTPRTVMLAFQQNMLVGDIVDGKRNLPYSRIPIYDKNIDDVAGFVLRHDLLKAAANNQSDVPLKSMKRQMHSVPETLTVTKVLDEFMTRQEHIFLVFDEYGGTSGIITMEDAVESLLGAEITDESDLVADMRQLAELRYQRQKQLLEESQLAPSNGFAPTRTNEVAPNSTGATA
jgi:CBS domain containing-hemolysin-like protein